MSLASIQKKLNERIAKQTKNRTNWFAFCITPSKAKGDKDYTNYSLEGRAHTNKRKRNKIKQHKNYL